MSDPSCRTYRDLLGVYVVGAIEPAERAMFESHLSQCYECREELAELALLPALMHRVPAEEAEHIAAQDAAYSDIAAPSSDQLRSLLKRVGAKRRARRLRAAFATAAALLIGVGGATAAAQAFNANPSVVTRTSSSDVATARSHGVAVTVRYAGKTWGTSMQVRAEGLPAWTRCEFWVVSKDGQRSLAGGWLVGGYGGGSTWYPARSYVPKSSIASFVLTSGHKVIAHIPAD